jgi:hypothetical protein
MFASRCGGYVQIATSSGKIVIKPLRMCRVITIGFVWICIIDLNPLVTSWSSFPHQNVHKLGNSGINPTCSDCHAQQSSRPGTRGCAVSTLSSNVPSVPRVETNTWWHPHISPWLQLFWGFRALPRLYATKCYKYVQICTNAKAKIHCLFFPLVILSISVCWKMLKLIIQRYPKMSKMSDWLLNYHHNHHAKLLSAAWAEGPKPHHVQGLTRALQRLVISGMVPITSSEPQRVWSPLNSCPTWCPMAGATKAVFT